MRQKNKYEFTSKWEAVVSAVLRVSGNPGDNETEVHAAIWGLKEEPKKNLLSWFHLIGA